MNRTLPLFFLALTACGSGGASNNPPNNHDFAGSCCLNGSFYACGDKAAYDKCAGFDVGACHAACSGPDFTCHMQCDEKSATATHDPSACTRDSAKDGQCKTSGSCVGSRGSACTYSTQCSSGNCTDGYCYATSNGNPCTYSTQCASGNCTDGCCYGNSRGDACTYSTQCSGGNCTSGVCQ